MDPTFSFKAEIWLWSGKAAWHFITIDKKLSDEIKQFNEGPRLGFGSVKVQVQIGATKWKTSIFPEKKGTYLLPIKAAVRKNEGLKVGDTVHIVLTLI
ncbi:DUF1905 domain-containing protein [Candidatus Peregrinibacteria bacterium]|nr:MAG: DUF1905 domain-containing protein [Candidatus Peregrinibacteria bacterium]